MEGVVLFSAPKVQITAMVLQQYTIKQTLLVTTTKYEKKNQRSIHRGGSIEDIMLLYWEKSVLIKDIARS